MELIFELEKKKFKHSLEKIVKSNSPKGLHQFDSREKINRSVPEGSKLREEYDSYLEKVCDVCEAVSACELLINFNRRFSDEYSSAMKELAILYDTL